MKTNVIFALYKYQDIIEIVDFEVYENFHVPRVGDKVNLTGSIGTEVLNTYPAVPELREFAYFTVKEIKYSYELNKDNNSCLITIILRGKYGDKRDTYI